MNKWIEDQCAKLDEEVKRISSHPGRRDDSPVVARVRGKLDAFTLLAGLQDIETGLDKLVEYFFCNVPEDLDRSLHGQYFLGVEDAIQACRER